RRLLRFNGLAVGNYRPRVERDSVGLKIVFVNTNPHGASLPFRVPPFPAEGEVRNFYSSGEWGVATVEKSMLTDALEPLIQWALTPEALEGGVEPENRRRERRAFNDRAFTVTTDESGRLPFSFSEAVPAPRKVTAPEGVLRPRTIYRLSLEWLWGAGPVLALSRRGDARLLAFGRWRRAWASGQKTVAMDGVAEGTSLSGALAAAGRSPALLLRQGERLRQQPNEGDLADYRRRTERFNAVEAPQNNKRSGHALLDDPFDGTRWVFRGLGDTELQYRRFIEWRPGIGPVVYFLYDGSLRLRSGRVKVFYDLFRARAWAGVGAEEIDVWALKRARGETLEASRAAVTQFVEELAADPVFGRGNDPSTEGMARFLRWVAGRWAESLGGAAAVPPVWPLWSPRLNGGADHFYVRIPASTGEAGRDKFRIVLREALGRSRVFSQEIRDDRLILTARPLEPGQTPYRCEIHLTNDRFFDFACRFFAERLAFVRDTRRSVLAAAGNGGLESKYPAMVEALKTLRSAAYYFGRRVNVLVTALGPVSVGRPQSAWRQISGKYFNAALFKLTHLVQGLERVEREAGKAEFERRFATAAAGAFGPAWPLDRDDVLIRLAARVRSDIDAARRGQPSSASRWPANLPPLSGNE
ncbi:MAG TPA: hypothetical protein PKC50_06640, partial [Elusimicrobiota bacterium]|nr:hypothetical protein [Elusimicrobiota bacterium]